MFNSLESEFFNSLSRFSSTRIPVPADAMSEKQTFRSEVNGSIEMKGTMEYWSVGLKPITPSLYYSNPINPTREVHVP
jgi:hypothetical protein